MRNGHKNIWKAHRVADPLIRVANLYKVFGSDPKSVMAMVREGRPKEEIRSETGHALALKGIDLEIEASEIFVIMGLSGSGKSTLIRHLNRDKDRILLLAVAHTKARLQIARVHRRVATLREANGTTVQAVRPVGEVPIDDDIV